VVKPFGVRSREGHNSAAFYRRRLYEKNPTRSDSADATGNKIAKKKQSNQPSSPATSCPTNVLYHSDSRNMTQLPDKSVHLMITSPPYNVGKEYDEDLSLTEYQDLLSSVFAETYRVLVDGGRACINIANVGRKPYIPLHAVVIQLMFDLGYLMRGEIIWQKGASAGTSCAWGSWRSPSNPVLRDTHEYILVFCKHSFRRTSTAPTSIKRDEFLAATKSVWTLARDTVWEFPAESAKRAQHPAPFPTELPSRLIALYSYVGDVILDPFMGSGTTAEAAFLNKRKYVGYDINEEYTALARRRLDALTVKNENEGE